MIRYWQNGELIEAIVTSNGANNAAGTATNAERTNIVVPVTNEGETKDNAAGQYGSPEHDQYPDAAPMKTRVEQIARYMESLENFDDAKFLRRLEALVHQQQEALKNSQNYINHVGANAVMRGQPHPQQWIVDANNECDAAYAALEKEIERG